MSDEACSKCGSLFSRETPDGHTRCWECGSIIFAPLPRKQDREQWTVRQGGEKAGKLLRCRTLNYSRNYPLDKSKPWPTFEWVNLKDLRTPPHYADASCFRICVARLTEEEAREYAKECKGVALRVADVPELQE